MDRRLLHDEHRMELTLHGASNTTEALCAFSAASAPSGPLSRLGPSFATAAQITKTPVA